MAESINIFKKKSTGARKLETFCFWIFRLITYFIILAAGYIFFDIGWNGGKVVLQAEPPFVNVEFLTQKPETLHVFEHDGKEYEMGDRRYQQFLKDNPGITLQNDNPIAHSAGGIFPCIVGTILLVTGAIVIALVLGVLCAIYLSEYSHQGKFMNFVRLSILNLAGVPSIVFGLFGMGMFVLFLDWNVSLMAGWFTLAFMILPIVITASEESLRAVPRGFREGSLALGATKWQTIRKNVLPYALPGILTSSILGITRVAGETAPIMFTAAYVVRDELPWEVQNFADFLFQGVMALPYHMYVVSTKIPKNEYTESVQYGTCFVFMVVVIGIALFSVLLRMKVRQKIKW